MSKILFLTASNFILDQSSNFDLHQEIANDLGASNIDYRRLTCSAVAIDESQTRKVQKPPSKKLESVEWVDRAVVGSATMGTEENVAQVHPLKLCEKMYRISLIYYLVA